MEFKTPNGNVNFLFFFF
uniref:Uncharacterized protein n=1 Tax=Anguilla anguilla TaxID=7936 RepID=A0A0E9UHN4_ANGAN